MPSAPAFAIQAVLDDIDGLPGPRVCSVGKLFSIVSGPLPPCNKKKKLGYDIGAYYSS